ncbi:MAG: hypothetical protein IPH05_05565 [Flavobacteriales bacterium]|jgi:hypothetical protein|nr:hypothetical protein [Flavobacteriales bacterium]MBK6882401.1 hypothetical protein [Flavobacteriales bacterium]MBK7112092.1 hypothetical protein [Flavobacteriales bacterium]MBK7481912.1 hypothetical protein [Flavobacteriales bacterium]MBK8532286.1 hypothetical protein [Flavobacteriales bacterium]
MTTTNTIVNPRTAGATAIIGAITMLAGAGTWMSTGTDLDAALMGGTVADYLIASHAKAGALALNIGLWTMGAVLMCAGGVQLALLGRSRPQPAALAAFAYAVGAASAIVFFPLWYGIIVGLSPAQAAGADVSAFATALGHSATTADWLATVMILAVGGMSVANAGRDTWVPRWLHTWSYFLGVAGVLSLMGIVLGDRSTYGMLIVPIGIGWLIAAGIVAMRYKG